MNLWFWLFLVSCILICGLSYYIFWLIRYISDVNEDLTNMSYNFRQFEQHLSTIYEMEMFYGDDTLKSLLSHTKELKESLEEMQILLQIPTNEEDAELEES